MIENQHHMPKGGWIAAAVSALGAAVFFLWQPVMEYFITGTYDDNVVIQLEADSLKLETDLKLLVIRIRAANKGNVPVKLTSEGKGDLTIEIHKIDKSTVNRWIDPTQSPLVTKKMIFEANAIDLIVAPNSYWTKEVALAIPNGTYWIKSTLNRKNGDQIVEAAYYEHGKQQGK